MNTNILSTIAKEPETRTTCTLSQEGSSALDRLKKEYGLTQKQVFDLFITKQGVKEDLMNKVSATNNVPLQRQIRKSLVVTKRNLRLLNVASEQSGMQRDNIIDNAFIYIVALIKNDTEQQKEQHRKSLLPINKSLEFLLETEKELQGFLDDEDVILSRYSRVIDDLNKLVIDIGNDIKNRTGIYPDGW